MTNQKLTIIGVSLLVLFLVTSVVTFRQQAQDKSLIQKDEPTEVQIGQITEKEREYSKEYKKLYPSRKARKFSEIIEESERLGKTKEELGGYVGLYEPFFMPDAPVITPAEFLGKLSCKADAIVIGSVKSNSSHMTEDETFIYTEYEFLVQDILKNNSTYPIEINNTIEITRPGGLIKFRNRRIKIEDKSHEPLQKSKVYLLFLRFVPSANGFIVASSEGDFVLENNSFNALAKRLLPKELKIGDNSETLLKAVRKSTSAVCNQIPKEATYDEYKY